MAFIFASNPDSLAGQRNYYDQQNIAVAEQDRAIRQQVLNEAASRAWDQQNRDQQQAYQFAMTQQSRQDQAAANAQNRADQYFQFATQRQDKTAADTESKRRFDVGLDLSKSEVESRKAQYDYSKAQNDYSQAYNDIMSGTIAKPEDIKSLYPNLSPLDVNRAQAAFMAKTKNEMEAYSQIDSGAKAATGFIRSTNPGTPEKSGHWYQFGAGGAAAVPPKQLTEEEALDAISKNKAFAKIMPHIQWDESSQSFTPSMPKPALLSPPTQNVPRGTSATSSPTIAQPTPAIIPVTPASVPGPVAASPQPPLAPGSGLPPDQLRKMAQGAKRAHTASDIPPDAEGVFILDDGSVVQHNPTFSALPVPPRAAPRQGPAAPPVLQPAAAPTADIPAPTVTANPAQTGAAGPLQQPMMQPSGQPKLVPLDDPKLDAAKYGGFTGGQQLVGSYKAALRSKEQAVLDRLEEVKRQNPGKTVTIVKQGGRQSIGLDGRPYVEPEKYYAQIIDQPAAQPTGRIYPFRTP